MKLFALRERKYGTRAIDDLMEDDGKMRRSDGGRAGESLSGAAGDKTRDIFARDRRRRSCDDHVNGGLNSAVEQTPSAASDHLGPHAPRRQVAAIRARNGRRKSVVIFERGERTKISEFTQLLIGLERAPFVVVSELRQHFDLTKICA